MPDPERPPDDDLIERIAAGDREAFADLYRRRRPDVYRFALHMCGSSSIAEDVVQDVFVAVIEHAARYQPGRSGVVAWLLGIARNHVRRCRSRSRALPLPDDDSDAGRRLGVEMDPVVGLTRQRHHAALARALLDLPAAYREAIVLCDLQEFSYAAAAHVLGCRIGTVRSRLARGRARLARALCGPGVICRVPASKAL